MVKLYVNFKSAFLTWQYWFVCLASEPKKDSRNCESSGDGLPLRVRFLIFIYWVTLFRSSTVHGWLINERHSLNVWHLKPMLLLCTYKYIYVCVYVYIYTIICICVSNLTLLLALTILFFYQDASYHCLLPPAENTGSCWECLFQVYISWSLFHWSAVYSLPKWSLHQSGNQTGKCKHWHK